MASRFIMIFTYNIYYNIYTDPCCHRAEKYAFSVHEGTDRQVEVGYECGVSYRKALELKNLNLKFDKYYILTKAPRSNEYLYARHIVHWIPRVSE